MSLQIADERLGLGTHPALDRYLKMPDEANPSGRSEGNRDGSLSAFNVPQPHNPQSPPIPDEVTGQREPIELFRDKIRNIKTSTSEKVRLLKRREIVKSMKFIRKLGTQLREQSQVYKEIQRLRQLETYKREKS